MATTTNPAAVNPAAVNPAAVDTAHVSGRRRLHFDRVSDIMADVDALAAGGYRQLGNWSLGQICKHLATGMSMALDGTSLKPPWFVRFVATMYFKPRVLRDGMKPGFKLNPKAAKVFVPDPTADAEGIAVLGKMIQRWETEPCSHAHPFFGRLTREEWNTIALRHGELHLSFLVPK